MAAGIDEVQIRPRGRVPVGTVLSANARWRDRLVRNVTTLALGFEADLSSLAERAARLRWPVVTEADPVRPFPVGSFDGLRIGWLAWYENGTELIAPDWSLRHDGRALGAGGRVVDTGEIVANLIRIGICDDAGPPAERRRRYDFEMELAAANARNALVFLERRLVEGPVVSRGGGGPARRLWQESLQ